MNVKSILIFAVCSIVVNCDSALSHGDVTEARGKKKKIALFGKLDTLYCTVCPLLLYSR